MEDFSLERIKILVTSGCNLKCTHCYQHQDKNRYSLTKEQILEVIDYGIEKNVRIIDFSGGEFFVHPAAYEMLDYCYEKNLEVNVATNGTMVNTDALKKYANMDFLTVQLSVDGLKDHHEARRGAGNWDKLMQTVEALHALGIKLTANMVLDEHNYPDALEVMQMPYFSEIFFTPVAYVGAAAGNTPGDELEEYEEFVCQLLREFECEEEAFRQQIFPNTMSVRYDGGVYISPIAGDYELMCIGNIHKETIETICERYYESEDFRRLQALDVKEIQKCNLCSAKDICDRGNRLRALKFSGDIMAPDVFMCRIYLDEYKDIPVGKLFWGIE